MALIKHANAEKIAKSAIVLDLGDLHRQGQAMIAHARAQADAIIAEAREERERIISGAAEQGRAAGFAKGVDEGRVKGAADAHAEALAARRADLDRLVDAWSKALASFGQQRDHMTQAAEREVIALACLIAGKVVKRSIALDPGIVVDQLRAVLGTLVRASELVIAVNPADRPVIDAAFKPLLAQFPAVRSVELVEDAALARGSCVARTREPGAAAHAGAGPSSSVARTVSGGGLGGEIDASINAQLDRIVEVLLPGAGHADQSPPAPAHGARP